MSSRIYKKYPKAKAAQLQPGLIPEREHPQAHGSRALEGKVHAPGGIFFHVGDQPGDELDIPEDVEERSKAQKKKEQQWKKWSEEVIPAMIEPYLSLLEETDALRDLTAARNRKLCAGCVEGSTLQVSCIYFDKIEKVNLCTCSEPALQLLSLGLFPCAPSRPTLAVDLNMLDLVRGLFLNSAPNVTAWCETLEGFLSARKFKLTTRDTLRKRFGNALQWYATLEDSKNQWMHKVINNVQKENRTVTDTIQDQARPGTQAEATEPSTPVADDANTPPLDRPSEYLRERCPVCFGGKDWHQPQEMVDAIVCIDACFTQKRRKSQGNSTSSVPRHHPETIFVPPSDVATMQATVESIRPAPKPKEPAMDGYEPGMKVSAAALDECFESFQAADANRVKASTKFFADTGLMALLCRHDRVLWLVNMTSAGEKQYYALCLLEQLFKHIPPAMRIGVLYDIGCQLHRSCIKHGFLQDILDRITFGISVFHAYGHQWPCQIIYHPRKCPGFGLTDGEGCERFWSSIKSLIPSLHVSGYYTRIYTIDTKVRHLDQISLLGMGKWLRWKWTVTLECKGEASEVLDGVYATEITEEDLRAHWANQVKEQTKPLPRQSKNIADKEIHSILLLKEQVTEYEKDIAAHRICLLDLTMEEIQVLKAKLNNATKAIKEKSSKLSIADQSNLKRLLGNQFLHLRLNALAVKQRIRDRLRQCKFELESLEKSYRKTVNRLKLEAHAGQQLKRKEPGIQNLARKYNKLCQEMEKLIQNRRAPRGARVPPQIELGSLFKLDVDDDIWQDIGLMDEMDESSNIPEWLGDDDVRKGIKALLLFDRCLEEEQRLIKEWKAMQDWFIEEWQHVQKALDKARGDNQTAYAYQLQNQKEHLLCLCLAWEPLVRAIPCDLPDSWGPSEQELLNARIYEVSEQVLQKASISRQGNNDEESSDEELSDGESEDKEEADILDTMEESGFADGFRL
ncbi:hypothetical protein CPB84DRAFT_1855562 [Gymnopilus junonius]|uniref:CxC1-like cysteine cluster associated with KDZ transposases domain-containing protein n=1 Tax=Gymnopilus junonius TaxID=109634 RepID=A0A9P5N7S1_GYMJU|nr:hypothetical protein CPB84DRAFT_1855562 [Gymnopilus junonius]